MTPMETTRLELTARNLFVSYDSSFALQADELNLTGNVVAILGHNGAGKSTLIKTILGLLTPNRGSLEVRRVSDSESTVLIPEEHMAFCPETGAVFHDISVESYVRLWCRMKQNDPSYYKHSGKDIIDTLELGPLLPKLGRELSKGQRRRVQTAIGFLTNPKLFLFDEPFDGLDVQRSSELTELIESYTSRMSIMLSSHRMDVIERLADAVLVLKEGRILTAGPVDAVCTTLCGQSWTLGNIVSIDDAIDSLKSAFPTALVGRLGHQVAITGHQPNEHALRSFAQHKLGPLTSIESLRPSLTDAMNYHLKLVRLGDSASTGTPDKM